MQGQDAFRIVHQEKDVCEARQTDLRAGSIYEFYVQSYGVRGDGPSTPVLAVRTSSAPPALPPDNLRVVEAMMDEILVAWDPPTDGCDVTGYR